MRNYIIIFLLVLFGISCKNKHNEVVVYCSLDQIYAEPIIKDFEHKTGITVNVLYDNELTKTVGLVNRIIAESSNPRCDVFWNSEIIRTIVLKNKGILQPYHSPSAFDIPSEFKDKNGFWTGFAARGRIIIYNKGRLKNKTLPNSFFDLIKPEWNGKAAIAYPMFGTSSAHFASIFTLFGRDSTTKIFKKIKNNNIAILAGNATVRDQVVNGDFLWGFTDTDDVNGAIVDGKNVGVIYPDMDGIGTFIIPNTICLLKNSKNEENAKKFIDFVLRPETEKALAFSRAAQIPVRKYVACPKSIHGLTSIKAMTIDYEKVSAEIENASLLIHDIFIR